MESTKNVNTAKKNKNDQNKTQHCLILLSPPGTISRLLHEQDQLIMLNFCNILKQKRPITAFHKLPLTGSQLKLTFAMETVQRLKGQSQTLNLHTVTLK